MEVGIACPSVFPSIFIDDITLLKACCSVRLPSTQGQMASLGKSLESPSLHPRPGLLMYCVDKTESPAAVH